MKLCYQQLDTKMVLVLFPKIVVFKEDDFHIDISRPGLVFSPDAGFWWKAGCSFQNFLFFLLSQQLRTCWLPHTTRARTSRSLWSRSTVHFHLAAVSMKDPNTTRCCSLPCLFSWLGLFVFFGKIAKTDSKQD